jgi:hypothetical protein
MELRQTDKSSRIMHQTVLDRSLKRNRRSLKRNRMSGNQCQEKGHGNEKKVMETRKCVLEKCGEKKANLAR